MERKFIVTVTIDEDELSHGTHADCAAALEEALEGYYDINYAQANITEFDIEREGAKEVRRILGESYRLYKKGGSAAVIEWNERELHLPYGYCGECASDQPVFQGDCLSCWLPIKENAL